MDGEPEALTPAPVKRRRRVRPRGPICAKWGKQRFYGDAVAMVDGTIIITVGPAGTVYLPLDRPVTVTGAPARTLAADAPSVEYGSSEQPSGYKTATGQKGFWGER